MEAVAQTPGPSRQPATIAAWPRTFIPCRRYQTRLPPELRDWLPEGHLALFVLDAVEEPELGSFYGAYREDGWGHPAYDPATMVGLLLYAYARGVPSAREIERRCVEDVAFRVVSGASY
jgi:transposase